MARIPYQSCSCEDWPCCGHVDEALTGEDIPVCPDCGELGCTGECGNCDYDSRDEECDDLDESMDGDFDSGMASAGFGTDEDYGYYGDETPFGEELDGGYCDE